MNILSKNDLILKKWRYPGGEIGVDLNMDLIDDECNLFVYRINDLEDIFTLLAIKDEKIRKKIIIPYLPYLREDNEKDGRVAFGSFLIKELTNYSIFMPHTGLNYAQTLMVNNIFFRILRRIMANIINDYFVNDGMVFVFADSSGKKRYHFIYIFSKDIFIDSLPEKIRDRSTGGILYYKIPDDWKEKIKNKHIFVLDDICDGGATFKMLQEAIHSISPSAKLHLFTPHGIYSNNAEKNLKEYEAIYCLNTVNKIVNRVHPNQFVYDFESFFKGVMNEI